MKKIFFSLLILLASASAAHAQTLSLGIWPPILEATLQPGKTITQVYRLQNQGDDTVITVQMVPFEPDGESGQIKLSLTADPAPAYFSLLNADLKGSGGDNLATFALKSGASQELVLKITVPETAGNGDHYFSLLLSADTKHLVSGSGAKSFGSVGANILLTITNSEVVNQTAKIEELNLQGRILKFLGINVVDSFANFDFLIRVKNTSAHFFKTIGHLTITNTFGRDLTTIVLREDNILAGSIRSLTSEVKNSPTSEVSGVSWNPVFPLGKYTATVTVTPENSTNTVSQSLTFWALPYKAILALALLIFFYYLIKSRKNIL